ncbi:MAG: NAD-binding protein [Acidovorax sp.]|uniref:NAD-binding protein n=1 Tax=Acidovorax sp. TaxID=1872122 RepID=UPI00391D60D2
MLLARGVDIAIFENDTDTIRAAAKLGFKVRYGDGTRPDVLHASGAHHAKSVLVCTDDAKTTTHIVELLNNERPLIPVLTRAHDRQHAIELLRLGLDYQMRETFESAMSVGMQALESLGVDADEVADVANSNRARDADRLQLELADNKDGARQFFWGKKWIKTPLTQTQRTAQALHEEVADAIEHQE